MKYISNAFSLQMVKNLKEGNKVKIIVEQISKDDAEDAIETGEYKSIVGHADIAKIIGVEFNRENIEIKNDDELLVAQYIGQRLPEGTTKLPDDAKIIWCHIKFE